MHIGILLALGFVAYGLSHSRSCRHNCNKKTKHASLHHFYLISDRLSDGHPIVEQKWSYEDFCDVTIRLDDCTYALNRQVEAIALVRSFRPIPVEEFDRIARPLIM